MNKKLVALLFLFVVFYSYSKENDNKPINKSTVRYDVSFVGNADSFLVVHHQTKLLAGNIGAQELYNDNRDFGNLRFTVFDLKSSEILYRKGFSPIFQEWLATDEAKTKRRSFYQGLFFPKPSANVLLIIENRTKTGEWEKIHSAEISFADFWITTEQPAVYPIDTMLYSGISSEKIDLVILSEGYTSTEQCKFVADAKRMTDTLLASPPFNEMANRFNVYAVSVPSVESGADRPDEKVFRNTAFSATWFTFNSTRYLTTSDMKPIYDAVDGISWDHLIVLVNSDRYGGGGFYNFLSICSSDNERSPFVFIHEFGHSFGGLADEYYGSGDDPIYLPNVEPWEPNITTLANFDSKWKAMIDKSIPVPTPRDTVYSGKVGLFEGGGYQEKGVFSPAFTCWMKEQKAGSFCPVCREAIRKTILLQSR
jgi:hypothetical protein